MIYTRYPIPPAYPHPYPICYYCMYLYYVSMCAEMPCQPARWFRNPDGQTDDLPGGLGAMACPRRPCRLALRRSKQRRILSFPHHYNTPIRHSPPRRLLTSKRKKMKNFFRSLRLQQHPPANVSFSMVYGVPFPFSASSHINALVLYARYAVR